jgi:hypothetical protein
VFSSNLTTPGVSFSAALRGSTAQQQQPQAQQVPVANPPTEVKLRTPASGQQQKASQTVRARTVNGQPPDNMLRAVTMVQQIMAEFNGAVSEKDKKWPLPKLC